MNKLLTLEGLKPVLQKAQEKFLTKNTAVASAENLTCGHALNITKTFHGVLKRYGILLNTIVDYYGEMGAEWAVEFFIKSKTELKEFPATPAVHFFLKDKNENVLALLTSKAFKFGENPREVFYIGTLDADAYYFEAVESTLSDGKVHHVYIDYKDLEDESLIRLFIDGKPYIEAIFSIRLEGLSKMVFGGDVFTENPQVENLAVFDKIRLLGEMAQPLNVKEITVPTGEFSITETTLILYQDGILIAYAEESDSDAG